MCPLVIISVLMAIIAAPTANYITTQDIRNLTKDSKADEVRGAITKIVEAMSLIERLNVGLSTDTKLAGELRSTLVYKLCDKIPELLNKSMVQIASDFFEGVIKESKIDDASIVNPWKDAASATVVSTPPETPAVGAAPGSAVVEYDDHGVALGVHRRMVLEKGFDVDSVVKHKQNGTLHSIILSMNKSICQY